MEKGCICHPEMPKADRQNCKHVLSSLGCCEGSQIEKDLMFELLLLTANPSVASA